MRHRTIELLMQRPSNSSIGRRERAFGRVLREVRQERGISQEQLGFDSGCHRTYISFLERGKKNPTLATIFNLAETLHLPAWELVRQVEARLK
jgi:transcriptional regulator with XRE-family HTH domain